VQSNVQPNRPPSSVHDISHNLAALSLGEERNRHGITLTAPGLTIEFDTQLAQLPSPHDNHGSSNLSSSVTPGVSPQRPLAHQPGYGVGQDTSSTMQLAFLSNFKIRMCVDPNAFDSRMPHSNFPSPDTGLSVSHPATPAHLPPTSRQINPDPLCRQRHPLGETKYGAAVLRQTGYSVQDRLNLVRLHWIPVPTRLH
jgi:hypothetical protein